MKRYAAVSQVKPGDAEQYTRLHADVWPGVASMIEQCNIRNYSIFLKKLPDGNEYLFSYFEYVGTDFDKDMAKMAADPETQRWWSVCKPLLVAIDDLPPGEVWAPVEEVFHQD